MEPNLNTRLAKVIETHAEIRPKDGLSLYLFRGCFWCWSSSPDRYNKEGYESDEAAHAIIFRAMVESLPRGCSLCVAGLHSTETGIEETAWNVFENFCVLNKDGDEYLEGQSNRAGPCDTALDAACSFWESRPLGAKEGR